MIFVRFFFPLEPMYYLSTCRAHQPVPERLTDPSELPSLTLPARAATPRTVTAKPPSSQSPLSRRRRNTSSRPIASYAGSGKVTVTHDALRRMSGRQKVPSSLAVANVLPSGQAKVYAAQAAAQMLAVAALNSAPGGTASGMAGKGVGAGRRSAGGPDDGESASSKTLLEEQMPVPQKAAEVLPLHYIQQLGLGTVNKCRLCLELFRGDLATAVSEKAIRDVKQAWAVQGMGLNRRARIYSRSTGGSHHSGGSPTLTAPLDPVVTASSVASDRRNAALAVGHSYGTAQVCRFCAQFFGVYYGDIYELDELPASGVLTAAAAGGGGSRASAAQLVRGATEASTAGGPTSLPPKYSINIEGTRSAAARPHSAGVGPSRGSSTKNAGYYSSASYGALQPFAASVPWVDETTASEHRPSSVAAAPNPFLAASPATADTQRSPMRPPGSTTHPSATRRSPQMQLNERDNRRGGAEGMTATSDDDDDGSVRKTPAGQPPPRSVQYSEDAARRVRRRPPRMDGWSDGYGPARDANRPSLRRYLIVKTRDPLSVADAPTAPAKEKPPLNRVPQAVEASEAVSWSLNEEDKWCEVAAGGIGSHQALRENSNHGALSRPPVGPANATMHQSSPLVAPIASRVRVLVVVSGHIAGASSAENRSGYPALPGYLDAVVLPAVAAWCASLASDNKGIPRCTVDTVVLGGSGPSSSPESSAVSGIQKWISLATADRPLSTSDGSRERATTTKTAATTGGVTSLVFFVGLANLSHGGTDVALLSPNGGRFSTCVVRDMMTMKPPPPGGPADGGDPPSQETTAPSVDPSAETTRRAGSDDDDDVSVSSTDAALFLCLDVTGLPPTLSTAFNADVAKAAKRLGYAHSTILWNSENVVAASPIGALTLKVMEGELAARQAAFEAAKRQQAATGRASAVKEPLAMCVIIDLEACWADLVAPCNRKSITPQSRCVLEGELDALAVLQSYWLSAAIPPHLESLFSDTLCSMSDAPLKEVKVGAPWLAHLFLLLGRVNLPLQPNPNPCLGPLAFSERVLTECVHRMDSAIREAMTAATAERQSNTTPPSSSWMLSFADPPNAFPEQRWDTLLEHLRQPAFALRICGGEGALSVPYTASHASHLPRGASDDDEGGVAPHWSHASMVVHGGAAAGTSCLLVVPPRHDRFWRQLQQSLAASNHRRGRSELFLHGSGIRECVSVQCVNVPLPLAPASATGQKGVGPVEIVAPPAAVYLAPFRAAWASCLLQRAAVTMPEAPAGCAAGGVVLSSVIDMQVSNRGSTSPSVVLFARRSD